MPRAKRILMCGVMFAVGVQHAGSQGITFDTADVKSIFAVGNIITYHVDTLTKSADIGDLDKTSWDFSSLNTTSVTHLESMPVASTAYAVNFPQATHALRDTAFNYSFFYAPFGTTITLKGTGFVYYALQGNLLDYGLRGGGTAYFNSAAVPAQGQWLNAPASVDYALPLQFSNTWTTDYTESVSGTATLGFTTVPFGPLVTSHSISYTVDAYGRLTLPGAHLQEALRIRKVDRYVSGTTNGVRVGYVFIAKNGATVRITVNDTLATSGTASVSDVQWTEGMVEIPVPIQLARFTVTKWDGESVRLEWTTLSETNNFGFYVQRKGPDDREFSELPGAFVAGHGTTVVPQKYSFLDISGSADACWYRLKQVDLDGVVHLSEPVQVGAVTSVPEVIPTSSGLDQNYPNPFNPVTTIGYTIAGTGHEALGTGRVRLSVYDLLGREVAVLVDEERAPGSYKVKFDGTRLSSGVYIYRIQVRPPDAAIGSDSKSGAGDFVQMRKLLLLR